jgi:hypothetical protein
MFFFSCFHVKNNINITIFKICFDDNVLNIFWKHVYKFEMNIMKFEFSKSLINHCN